MGRGKKPRTALDVYLDTETIYPPNTIGSIGRVGLWGVPSDDTPFIETIEGLLNLQLSHPPQSTVEHQSQAILRFVVCDFLCRKFNITPPWPLVDDTGKPLTATERKYIGVLGAEATALFNLVSDVFAVVPIAGYDSAASVWGQMMVSGEYGILTMEMYETGAAGKYRSKKQSLDKYKERTQLLREREFNPFPDGAHKAFFDVAIRLSQQESGRVDEYSIHARSYRPYLKARSALSSYLELKKSKTKLIAKPKP